MQRRNQLQHLQPLKNDETDLYNKSIKAYKLQFPDFISRHVEVVSLAKPILVLLNPATKKEHLIKYQESLEITLQIELSCI